MGGQPRWDVIVVGARVAGASTAMLLAQAGLRVLLVDRARRGSDTLSTHALMRGGVVQLQRWELLDQVIAAGTPPIRRTTFHYGDEAVPVSIKPFAGVDALYAPRRFLIDRMLCDAAEDAGATLRFGTSLVDLSRDLSGRVDGVVLKDRNNERYVEHARLVVGADGRGSLVAELTGADTLLVGEHSGAYVYGYWPDLPVDGYHWFYGHARGHGLTGGLIPTNDGLSCIFVGASQPVMAAVARGNAPIATLRRLLHDVDPDLAAGSEAPPAGTVRSFRGAPARLRRAFGPGWALVGDSGWWKDPLSTHGMTDAFRDAELLALAVLSHESGTREVDALSAYQETRDRLSLPMHEVVDRLASHAWDLDEAQQLLRALSSAMAVEVEALLELPEPSDLAEVIATAG